MQNYNFMRIQWSQALKLSKIAFTTKHKYKIPETVVY